MANENSTETRKCLACGREFEANLGNRFAAGKKYCSAKCRRAADRLRCRDYETENLFRRNAARKKALAAVPPHDCRIRRRPGVGEFGEPITIEERF